MQNFMNCEIRLSLKSGGEITVPPDGALHGKRVRVAPTLPDDTPSTLPRPAKNNPAVATASARAATAASLAEGGAIAQDWSTRQNLAFVASSLQGAALEHDPKAPDWTGFMKHVRRDFDGGMVPDVVLPEPPINLDPVTEEATLASLDRADFRRKQMGADFIFVTVDGGEYWRLAQVHRWHS